jgi:hypothetical protein
MYHHSQPVPDKVPIPPFFEYDSLNLNWGNSLGFLDDEAFLSSLIGADLVYID